jgi:hypothetical protein
VDPIPLTCSRPYSCRRQAHISAEQAAGLQSADDAFIEVALLPLDGLMDALHGACFRARERKRVDLVWAHTGGGNALAFKQPT